MSPGHGYAKPAYLSTRTSPQTQPPFSCGSVQSSRRFSSKAAWMRLLSSHVAAQGEKLPLPRRAMTAERFMAQDAPRPLDEEEVREAVWELLFARVPRVLGRQAYARRAGWGPIRVCGVLCSRRSGISS